MSRAAGTRWTARTWLGLAAALALTTGLQVEMTARHWSRPFLDGAVHYDFDNAEYTRRSRDGIRADEARTQLGLTELSYAAWGEPYGEPAFYTHHPFLVRAAFQLFVRAFGDAEWVSRVFSLLISICIVAGTLLALRLGSGSTLAAALGTLVLVNVPLFAIYQSCVKFELDGMMLGGAFFLAVAWALLRPSRGAVAGVAVLACLSALAHWTAVLFVGAVVAWLSCERWVLDRREASAPLAASTAGLTAGVAAVGAAFAWLAGGVGPLVADLGAAARLRTDLSALTAAVWFGQQRVYVLANFGPVLPWLAAGVGTWLAVVAWRRRTEASSAGPERRLLPAYILTTLAAAAAWQLGFPQGSFIHVFWQLWFVLPVAGLVAAAVVTVEHRPARLAIVVAVLALAVHLHLASRDGYAETLALARGTEADVRFLQSQRSDRFTRFVFVPLEDVPQNGWFTGPTFPYYTGRKVVPIGEAGRVGSGDRLLVLRHTNQGELVHGIGEYLRVGLSDERCGSRFCAYDVRP